MKTQYFFIGLVILFSCTKEECPERIDLGVLRLSPESNRFAPSHYSDTLSTIEFISEYGGNQKFSPKQPADFEFGPLAIDQPCGDDPSITTRVSFKYEWNHYSLISTDSLQLSFIQTTERTTSSYYDIISIAFFDIIESRHLSQSFIITDLRNTPESLADNPIGNSYYDQKIIAGVTYYEVWGDDSTWVPSNVFYKKDLGFVGFIDKDGVGMETEN